MFFETSNEETINGKRKSVFFRKPVPWVFLPIFDVLLAFQDLDIVDLAGTLDWTPPVNVSGELLTYRGSLFFQL